MKLKFHISPVIFLSWLLLHCLSSINNVYAQDPISPDGRPPITFGPENPPPRPRPIAPRQDPNLPPNDTPAAPPTPPVRPPPVGPPNPEPTGDEDPAPDQPISVPSSIEETKPTSSAPPPSRPSTRPQRPPTNQPNDPANPSSPKEPSNEGTDSKTSSTAKSKNRGDFLSRNMIIIIVVSGVILFFLLVAMISWIYKKRYHGLKQVFIPSEHFIDHHRKNSISESLSKQKYNQFQSPNGGIRKEHLIAAPLPIAVNINDIHHNNRHPHHTTNANSIGSILGPIQLSPSPRYQTYSSEVVGFGGNGGLSLGVYNYAESNTGSNTNYAEYITTSPIPEYHTNTLYRNPNYQPQSYASYQYGTQPIYGSTSPQSPDAHYPPS